MKLNPCLFLLLFLFLISCKKDNGDDPDDPVVVDFFDLTINNIHFTAQKDASLVVVKTNARWTAACDADWIELSASEGDESTGFLIGASSNNYFPRECVINISSDGKTKEIQVHQDGVSSIKLEINGISFSFLPVYADTSFYLDGDTYLATRRVYLDSYFISETEITNAQWNAVTGDLPYDDENSGPQLPVVVNWNSVSNDFIPKINSLSEYKFRLPTENEWEVAARGGLKDINASFAGSMYIDSVAWHFNNSEGRKHPVAMKLPNELGLYDMSGNVSEWCSDWYLEWTEANRPPAESTNPTGPETGTDKVIRGGDFGAERFQYDRNNCRVSSRNFLLPGIDTEDFLYEGYRHFTGFRLVIDKN